MRVQPEKPRGMRGTSVLGASPLVVVAPEELYNFLAWLCAHGSASLEEAGQILRALADRPLDTLDLAQHLALVEIQGPRIVPTPAGQAWIHKSSNLPLTLGALKAMLPLETVLRWLKAGPVPQMRLTELFGGPLAEQAALALADWGELFGRWQQEGGWLYRKEQDSP